MLTIDRTLAVLMLTLAVAQKGRSHIVNRCQYLDADGFGDCIVGTGFALLRGREFAGVLFDRDVVSVMDDEGYTSTIVPNECSLFSKDLIRHLAGLGVTLTDGGYDVLRAAQRVQDSNRSWGEAFDAAAQEALRQHTA